MLTAEGQTFSQRIEVVGVVAIITSHRIYCEKEGPARRLPLSQKLMSCRNAALARMAADQIDP